MKMLVLVKQVPDTATQVKVGGDRKSDRPAGITWIVSPYDEFALEEALRIKEKRTGRGRGRGGDPRSGAGQGGAALVPGHGRRPRHPRERSGVRGRGHADRGPGAGRRGEAGEPALVLSGRQAIDDDMGAAGAQVAEVLGWPCASWIMEEAVVGGCEEHPGRPSGGRRARDLRRAAARGGDGPEGHERAAVPHAQGDHGRQEEGGQGSEGGRPQPAAWARWRPRSRSWRSRRYRPARRGAF